MKLLDQADYDQQIDALTAEAGMLEGLLKVRGKTAPARPAKTDTDLIADCEALEWHVRQLRALARVSDPKPSAASGTQQPAASSNGKGATAPQPRGALPAVKPTTARCVAKAAATLTERALAAKARS